MYVNQFSLLKAERSIMNTATVVHNAYDI